MSVYRTIGPLVVLLLLIGSNVFFAGCGSYHVMYVEFYSMRFYIVIFKDFYSIPIFIFVAIYSSIKFQYCLFGVPLFL